MLLFPGLPALGQGAPAGPPASPSEQALQAPLDLGDEKPTPSQSAPEAPSAWSAFGSVLLVAALAGGGLWAFRKWGVKRMPGTGGSRIKVEETFSLGDRRFLSIVKADGEKYLIALSPQSITLIARMDDLDNLDAPGAFEQALGQQMTLNNPMPVKDVEAMINGGRP